MAVNASAYDLPPLPSYTLTPRVPVLAPIPDNFLALILPIVAYWGLSMIFHYIDVNDYFPQYRLHTPAELLKRNHVSRWEVVRDVVFQQVVQTIAGVSVSYFDEPEFTGKEGYDVAVWASRLRVLQRSFPYMLGLFGIDATSLAKNLSQNGYTMLGGAMAGGYYPTVTQSMVSENGVEATVPAFTGWELAAASLIYWYLIPGLQFVWAVFVIDTWQYFLHRAMHLNRWLYVTFHSRHHRLYVPYAFGALYNHPVEGFLLDTAGTGVAFLTAHMNNRQAMFLFTFSTIKTVDDHSGYHFPWDPLQHFTSNNAAYHDIHHQSWGIKTNFSQPFFTFWDGLLQTRWRGDVTSRYERSRITSQQQVDHEAAQAAAAKADVAASPAVVSPENPPDTRSRLRRKAPSLSSPSVKGVNHGVTSSVL
ncbi:sphingosine hydroxylase [Aspergillus candidus]|uniref:Sphingolipid hydroxylase n=1 Tax=Aspergillus candidus TaxID=41067 RepID=A0A2I2EYB7_ASPCN|nr:sphingolipid hydroxylase [Aspergillus candidus]PLB33377.1 sphingolipid hydroxylase [Aspergillus candidus]